MHPVSLQMAREMRGKSGVLSKTRVFLCVCVFHALLEQKLQ